MACAPPQLGASILADQSNARGLESTGRVEACSISVCFQGCALAMRKTKVRNISASPSIFGKQPKTLDRRERAGLVVVARVACHTNRADCLALLCADDDTACGGNRPFSVKEASDPMK